MQTLEIDMPIKKDGTIQLPKQYQNIYGRDAHFVISLNDGDSQSVIKKIDLMQYVNTIDWPIDALEFQWYIRNTDQDMNHFQSNSTPQFGSCKGMLTIVAEDEEHLQDFAEYLS